MNECLGIGCMWPTWYCAPIEKSYKKVHLKKKLRWTTIPIKTSLPTAKDIRYMYIKQNQDCIAKDVCKRLYSLKLDLCSIFSFNKDNSFLIKLVACSSFFFFLLLRGVVFRFFIGYVVFDVFVPNFWSVSAGLKIY